jgi:hypothetical protein
LRRNEFLAQRVGGQTPFMGKAGQTPLMGKAFGGFRRRQRIGQSIGRRPSGECKAP